MLKKEAIIQLRHKNFSIRQIVKMVGTCKTHVCNVIRAEREKMIEEDGNTDEGENDD